MQIRDQVSDVYSQERFDKIQSLDNSNEANKKKLTDDQIIARTTKWRDSANTLTKEIGEIGDKHYAYYV